MAGGARKRACDGRRLVGQTRFEGFGFGFVTGFAEEGEHVLLVSFDTGLVEGVDVEEQTAHTAGAFEEVDELSEIVLVELGEDDAQVGHAAVDVSDARTEFGHLVHFVHALAGEEVEAVEVLFVGGEEDGVVGVFDRDDGFEDGAFAFLDPLSHGVEVGGEVDCSGEDADAVLTFAFAVELLPPLVHVVKFGLEVDEDLDLLAGTVEGVAHGGILRGDVVVAAAFALHVGGSFDEGVDVEAGAGDGEETDGGEDGETATDVVGDDEGGVAFLVGRGAGSALLGVGDSNDDFARHVFAALFLTLLLEETESECGLGGGAALGDVDHTELAVAEVLAEFVEVVLADVVAGEEDDRVGAVVGEPFELVAECFDDGAGSEIGTADAGDDDGVAVFTKSGGAGFDFGEEFGGDGRGEMHPSEEVIAGAGLCFECALCGRHVGAHGIQLALGEKRRGVVKF